MDDAEVMSQVQEGRVERLALLFERHHLHLFNFFLRLTGRREASEDMVQEVFLRILRHRSSFRPGAPFGPWLWQIARNVHRNHAQARPQTRPIEEFEEVLADARVPVDVQIEHVQDQDRLRIALACLPEEKRELLLLSRNPDLAYRDLAELMACSVGAVKVQVHRALKDLRAAFNALPGGVA